MFTLLRGKGFQITFGNGYEVRVEWGAGVGDHKYVVPDLPMSAMSVSEARNGERIVNSVAEVTATRNGEIVRYRMEATPEEVVRIIAQASIRDAEKEV